MGKRCATLSDMPRVNATVDERHAEQVAQMKEQAGTDISDAEATRRIFDRAAELEKREEEWAESRQEYRQRIEDMGRELRQAKARRDELRDELGKTNKRIDDVSDVAVHARQQLEERDKEQWERHRDRARERLRESAGTMQRLRWRVGGMPEDAIDEKAAELARRWGDTIPPGVGNGPANDPREDGQEDTVVGQPPEPEEGGEE